MANTKLSVALARLRAELPDLQHRYGIVHLGIFGSAIRQKNENANDIDILVEFDDRQLSLFDFVRLRGELSELLGKRVDLVEKPALKPRIGERILQEVVYLTQNL